MIHEILPVGVLQCNCSILGDEQTKDAIVIDPGDNIPGNAPRHFSNLRGDGVRNLDLSLSKEFTFKEGMLLQVRAEIFNAANHQRFAFPDVGSGDGSFGTVTSTRNNYRRMQFGARVQF